MMRLIFTYLLLFFVALPALAQNTSQQPLEITADTDLVWDQARHLYQARGNAKAVSGDMQLVAPLLEAAYDPKLGQQALVTIEAVGDTQNMVQLQSADDTAVAPRATYTLKTGQIMLHGPNVKLENPAYEITAQKNVTYSKAKNQAVATGNAQIFDKTNQRSLSAQTITAQFSQANGKALLQQAQAQGGVQVKTAAEFISAQSGTYNAGAQIITLVGNVKITRGPNQLNGEKAVVNLKTGQSSLQSAGKQRVRAMFYPNGGP
jgi:lipopolysaccharide export system protein LptA